MIQTKNEFNRILTTISEQCLYKPNIVIAIDGMCASGKTTLALMLQKIFNARTIHMDDFFLTDNIKTLERLLEVGGNIDYERFKDEIIMNLDKDIAYKPYNCHHHAFDKEKVLPLTALTIIEGAYALPPKFGEYYDYAVFMMVSNDQQIARIKQRNGSEMTKIFKDRWIKLENEYFDKFDIKSRCNIIFDTSEENENE